MSTSERTWRCRRCSAALGLVRRGGTLTPLAAVGSIDPLGVAQVACLDCGASNTWHPLGRAPSRRVIARPVQAALEVS